MIKKTSLSPAQQWLLETLQKINFGRIERLHVCNGQPVKRPAPRVVRDVKLGSAENGARPELDSADFPLKREHVELFETLRQLGTGTVEAIEVRHGLPFRLLIEQTAP